MGRTDFVDAEQIYQAVNIKDKGDFLVEIYDSEKPQTYLLPEVSGQAHLFGIRDAGSIIHLKDKMDWKILSPEMYNNIIKELEDSGMLTE